MRNERTIRDDPWVARSKIHLVPILDDMSFDPEKATLMFLPSRTMLRHHGKRSRIKSLLLLLAMLLILALELIRT